MEPSDDRARFDFDHWEDTRREIIAAYGSMSRKAFAALVFGDDETTWDRFSTEAIRLRRLVRYDQLANAILLIGRLTQFIRHSGLLRLDRLCEAGHLDDLSPLEGESLGRLVLPDGPHFEFGYLSTMHPMRGLTITGNKGMGGAGLKSIDDIGLAHRVRRISLIEMRGLESIESVDWPQDLERLQISRVPLGPSLPLGRLGRLEEISVEHCHGIEVINSDSEDPSRVRSFSIRDCHRLADLSTLPVMPHLTSLALVRMPSLGTPPLWWKMPSLSQLEVSPDFLRIHSETPAIKTLKICGRLSQAHVPLLSRWQPLARLELDPQPEDVLAAISLSMPGSIVEVGDSRP